MLLIMLSFNIWITLLLFLFKRGGSLASYIGSHSSWHHCWVYRISVHAESKYVCMYQLCVFSVFELTQAMIQKTKLWLLTHTGTFDSLSGSINWVKANKTKQTKTPVRSCPFHLTHVLCIMSLPLHLPLFSAKIPSGRSSHFESLSRPRTSFVFRLRHLLRVHGETQEGTQQVNDDRVDDDDNDEDEDDDPKLSPSAELLVLQDSSLCKSLR